MKQTRTRLAAITVAVLLAACGGGGSDNETKAKISSVKVFGDSLADVGTFGFKFTVQGAASFTYPELVAKAYGITSLCPAYVATSATTFVANPTAGCTDFAIGGGRINNPAAPTSKITITQQLTDAGTGTTYTASDMLLIDGGGNDAADLVGAFLAAQGPTGDSGAKYLALIGSLVPAATIAATVAQPNGQALLGGVYMQALANVFYNAIKANGLDKGATNVVILNIPGITKTPRFQFVLAGIAAASGGGTAGATARAQAEAVFDAWIQAFNGTLAALAAGDARIVVVDGYTTFNQEIADPAQFSLQNVVTPACPPVGVDAQGLPVYDFPNCTATSLSATQVPSGATGGADWWKSYLFSDSFHPTPYGHQLVYQRISLELARSGRL